MVRRIEGVVQNRWLRNAYGHSSWRTNAFLTKRMLCTDVKVSAADTLKSGSPRQRVRPVPTCYRFTRPGVIPTSTPHMDRLLGPQGIGQAGSDKVDTAEADEVIDAIAKTVAELTSQQDGVIRQQVIEQLMREIMNYDAEFRREDAADVIGSQVRHRSLRRSAPPKRRLTPGSTGGYDDQAGPPLDGN